MNVQKFFTSKVEEILATQRGTHAQAWNSAAKIYPDAVTLLVASGQTRQLVQFFNSRISHESAAAGRTVFNSASGKLEKSGDSTKAEERAQFANEVDTIVKKGVPYETAYRQVASRRPQFANSVKITMPGKKPVSAVADSSGANGVPIAAPQYKALFRLPQDTSDAEWAAAWAGNGSVASPINFGRVFDALVEFAQSQASTNYETALSATKARFPQLWEAVDQLAKFSHTST